MRFLFLDVDGVLNTERALMDNGHCGINQNCVRRLNRILRQFPDLRLVLSSTWRYMVINGDMTLRGFEEMLMTHGVDCYNMMHGVTASDEVYDFNGDQVRRRQIEDYVDAHRPRAYVVLDDIDLGMERQIRIVGRRGLQDADAEGAIAVLNMDLT